MPRLARFACFYDPLTATSPDARLVRTAIGSARCAVAGLELLARELQAALTLWSSDEARGLAHDQVLRALVSGHRLAELLADRFATTRSQLECKQETT